MEMDLCFHGYVAGMMRLIVKKMGAIANQSEFVVDTQFLLALYTATYIT